MSAYEEFGMQIDDVVETFHVQGKCVGCGQSFESWCKKHKQWGYALGNCEKKEVEPKKNKAKNDIRIAHNARPVICSNGKKFTSMKFAAKYINVSLLRMRTGIKNGTSIKNLMFEFEVLK